MAAAIVKARQKIPHRSAGHLGRLRRQTVTGFLENEELRAPDAVRQLSGKGQATQDVLIPDDHERWTFDPFEAGDGVIAGDRPALLINA
jgi:hypothetical protein